MPRALSLPRIGPEFREESNLQAGRPRERS
jgi:hypothetical protein